MITDLNTTDAEAQRQLRAKKAVEAFRRMQPMLNSYARAFTGNKRMTVEISATIKAATDGRKIFFCPPIGLGDDLKHVKSHCDKRDPESLLQRCEACRIKEAILVTIYHEIAHVCYGTFDAPGEHAGAELLDKVMAESPSKYAERTRKMVERAPSYVTDNFMGMASLINPYLKIILNALEDARVNNNLFAARRGTKAMFDAQSKLVFERGIEVVDPKTGEVTFSKWNERELNMQAILAVYCEAASYTYDDWFVPEIVTALADAELLEIITESKGATQVAENYGHSFRILKRLRDLGFCKNPDDPEDEQPEFKPQPEDEADDQSDDQPADEQDDSDADEDETDQIGESAEGSAEGDKESEDSEAGDDGAEPDASEDEAPGEGDESESDDGGEPSGDVAGDKDGSADDDSGTDDEGLGDDGDPRDDDESDQSGESDEAAGDDGEPGTGSMSDGDAGSESGETSPDEFESGESEQSDTSDAVESDDGSEVEREELADKESGEDDEEIDQGGMIPEDAVDLTDLDPSETSGLDWGTPDEVEHGLEVFGGHDEKPDTREEELDFAALEKAIIQGMYFETSSIAITGVREHRYGVPYLNEAGRDTSTAWTGRHYAGSYSPAEMGMTGNYKPTEAILGKPLLKLRTVFEANARSHHQAHLKSGRVNGRVLGKRAPLGDERLFRKKIIPGKRDYFVCIGLDISGSTIGRNLGLIKAAAWAQAELLTRLGVPFAMYAFTAAFEDPNTLSQGKMYLDMYLIKEAEEPWNAKTQDRLQQIGPDGGNLDGHNMEFFRKVCDRSRATDKIIMYYSDGRMPASNYEEELEILQRELETCKKKGYTVCGVGVRTDSPKDHGLPTVRVDKKEDIMDVVLFLDKMLRAK